jgi:protein PhnA
MSQPNCPVCDATDVLTLADHYECAVCGEEWALEAEAEEIAGDRVVKDAYGNVLANGDVVAMIKDLKLNGSSVTLKVGMKSKPIRLQDGDHEISCKMEGLQIGLKAMYVKKVTA